MKQRHNPGKSSRFERCVEEVSARGGVDDPAAVCAASLRSTGWKPRRNLFGFGGKQTYWYKLGRKPKPGEDFDGSYKAKDRAEAMRISKEIGQAHRKTIYVYRENPAEAAAALSEAFHGAPPDEVVEIERTEHYHEHVAGLAVLCEIHLAKSPVAKLDGFQGALLTSNEAGTQLYIDGGDQQVSHKLWPDLDWSKDSVILGRVTSIVYETAKFHLGKEDRKRGPYRHRLGEESGQMPDLVYDTVNRRLNFVGGNYRVRPEGIVD